MAPKIARGPTPSSFGPRRLPVHRSGLSRMEHSPDSAEHLQGVERSPLTDACLHANAVERAFRRSHLGSGGSDLSLCRPNLPNASATACRTWSRATCPPAWDHTGRSRAAGGSGPSARSAWPLRGRHPPGPDLLDGPQSEHSEGAKATGGADTINSAGPTCKTPSKIHQSIDVLDLTGIAHVPQRPLCQATRHARKPHHLRRRPFA
jgi:hypothetical protein